MGEEQNYEKRPFFINRLKLLSFGKGILAGYLLIIPIFAIIAYILTLMKFPEKYMTGSVIVVTTVSVIVAGFVTASSARTKGLLNGALTGFFYYLILFILSSIVTHSYSFGLSVLFSFITCILAGSLGGVLGINFKKSAKHKYKRA